MNLAYVTVSERIYERDRSVVHRVKYPSPGEPDFYRSVMSFDCFRNRELAKWYKQYDRGHGKAKDFKHAHVTYERDIGSIDSLYRLAMDSHNPTYIDHDSVWDFYKAVGYNYKTQKWT